MVRDSIDEKKRHEARIEKDYAYADSA